MKGAGRLPNPTLLLPAQRGGALFCFSRRQGLHPRVLDQRESGLWGHQGGTLQGPSGRKHRKVSDGETSSPFPPWLSGHHEPGLTPGRSLEPGGSLCRLWPAQEERPRDTDLRPLCPSMLPSVNIYQVLNEEGPVLDSALKKLTFWRQRETNNYVRVKEGSWGKVKQCK